MRFDSIIFDIDGTIWDAREVVALAWQDAIRTHTSLPADFDAESIGKHFGKPMTEIFQAMYPGLPTATIEEMTPYLYEYEHAYLRKYKPKPYAGMQHVLSTLAKQYRLMIVTNGQKGYAEAMLDATGFAPYFTGWLSFGDTMAPKAVTIRTLMQQYHVDNACYVGDTVTDRQACVQAGIPFIYCEYGLGDVEDAEISIETIGALPKAICILEQEE